MTAIGRVSNRVVDKYLMAMRSEELLFYPTWEEWLEIAPPYPTVGYEKKRVSARFKRNGYDWDINGALYMPKKIVNEDIAWVVTLGTNGSEGECDICPDGRPGLAAIIASQGFKVLTLSFPGHFHSPDGIWPMAVEDRKPIYLFDQTLSDDEIADRALKCTFDTNMQGVAQVIDENLPGCGIVVTNGTLGCRVPYFLKKAHVIGHTTIGFAGCDAWRKSWRENTGTDHSHKEFNIEGVQRKSPTTHRGSGYQGDEANPLSPWGGPDEFIEIVSKYRSQLKPRLTVNQHEGDPQTLRKYVDRTGLPEGEYLDFLEDPEPKYLKDLGVLVFVGMKDKKHWIYGDSVDDKREVYMAQKFAEHSKNVNVIPVPSHGHYAMVERYNEKFAHLWLWSHKDGYFQSRRVSD